MQYNWAATSLRGVIESVTTVAAFMPIIASLLPADIVSCSSTPRNNGLARGRHIKLCKKQPYGFSHADDAIVKIIGRPAVRIKTGLKMNTIWFLFVKLCVEVSELHDRKSPY